MSIDEHKDGNSLAQFFCPSAKQQGRVVHNTSQTAYPKPGGKKNIRQHKHIFL